MKIAAVKTDVIKAYSQSITDVLTEFLPVLHENSVVAITSKIVSLCEGSVINKAEASKEDIVKNEADWYLPEKGSRYGAVLAIKNGIIIANSGVDESNSGGYYVVWPKEPQKSADMCCAFIKEKYGLKNAGVIITDSATVPLKWGVTGRCIAYSGFKGINDRINSRDIYGRKFVMTKINVADALAASAVLCMGETDEQTPLAVIEDIPFIEFNDNPPSKKELDSGRIDIKDDLYGQMIEAVKWQKGGQN